MYDDFILDASGGGAAAAVPGAAAGAAAGQGAAAGAAGSAGSGGPGAAGAGAGGVLAAGAAALAGQAGNAPAGGQGAGTAGAPVSPIPAKYQVKKADGTLDNDASVAKWAEGHRHLEQRLGAGSAPPATPDDYKPELQGLDWDKLKADPATTPFLKAAHAKGITNDQLGFVLGAFSERIASMQPTPERAFAELQQAWPTPAEFSANARHAAKVINVFGAELTEADRAVVDSSPVMLRLLARIGAQLGEDTAPIVEGSPAAQSWDEQMAAITSHPGFMDKKHPEHAQLMAKQQKLYERRFPGKQTGMLRR